MQNAKAVPFLNLCIYFPEAGLLFTGRGHVLPLLYSFATTHVSALQKHDILCAIRYFCDLYLQHLLGCS